MTERHINLLLTIFEAVMHLEVLLISSTSPKVW